MTFPSPPISSTSWPPTTAAAGADIAYEMYARPHAVPGRRWQLLLGSAGRDHAHGPVGRGLGGPHPRDAADRGPPPAAASFATLVGRAVRVAMSADRDASWPAFPAALRTGAPRARTRSRSPGRWRSAGTAPRARPSTGRRQWPGRGHAGQHDPARRLAPPGRGDRAEDLGRRRHVHHCTPISLTRTSRHRTGSTQVPIDLSASAGTRATAFAPIPAGTVGILCATGTNPHLTFHDGGPIILGG